MGCNPRYLRVVVVFPVKNNKDHPKYKSEHEMCAQFAGYAENEGWTPYPETQGWDLLLVRKTDGYQIGVQAKLQMNLEVVIQTIARDTWSDGPDFKAILVPGYLGKIGQFMDFCPYIGVTIIAAAGPGQVMKNGSLKISGYTTSAFRPDLPSETSDIRDLINRHWFEQIPARRHKLPDYVPDVRPGASAPTQLTFWKIGAIKVCILAERQGFVTKSDFKILNIDHRRWTAGKYAWMQPDPSVRGFRFPKDCGISEGFKRQHPRNYAEIEADFEKWKPGVAAMHTSLL